MLKRFLSPMMLMFLLVAFIGIQVSASNPAGITNHADELNWFMDQRLGMFIHWGPVAQTGQEIGWSRGQGTPPVLPYDDLYKTFNPTGFNADTWVQIAKNAGMNYLVFTAKHMDGFCEFNSALTNYKITAPACPFGRDVCKELADACHNVGMGLGFYYIPEDWYSQPLMSNADYITYYTNQVVDELLSNYGRVDLIWYDNGPTNGGKVGADGPTLLNRMRAKQPWVLVTDRGDTGPWGDYSTPEQYVGTFDNDHPWESCMTIQESNQWAWDPDGGVKSLKRLIDMIVNCACGGGNCLLNIGPRADGVIDPSMVTRLQEIGNFMNPYGESIYETSGGPVKNTLPWGGATSKGNTMYVHLLYWTGQITIPSPNATIVSSSCLTGGTPTVTQNGGQISISLPTANINPLDTIIKIVFNSTVELTTPLTPVDDSISYSKPATQSSTYPNYPAGNAVDGSANTFSHTNSEAQAWWKVDLQGTYDIGDIMIINRQEYSDRLSDFWVYVLDNNGTTVWSNHQTTYPNPTLTLNAGGVSGRYVKVQLTGTNYLTLCEVKVYGTPTQGASMNVALAANGAAASGSSYYDGNHPASALINGDRKGLNWGNGGGWADGTPNSYPDWAEVDFNGSYSIGEIDVFTIQDNYTSPSDPTLSMTFSQYGITAFDVQYWNGSSWATVPGGSVTGNNKVWRQFTFTPVTTSKIRVVVNNALASYSRITEIEAWTASTTNQGPVAWYKFDETSGSTVADSSGNGNNGTAYNTTRITGKSGNALNFNGTNAYVSLGNPSGLNITGQITIAAWVKTDATLPTTGLFNIVARGYNSSPAGEVYLRIYNNSYGCGTWNGATYGTSYAIPAGDKGAWVHLAGVYDGSYWRLYRNGVQVASTAATTGACPVATGWAVGARSTGTERFYKGGIDNVRIYNRGLNATEAQSLYNGNN